MSQTSLQPIIVGPPHAAITPTGHPVQIIPVQTKNPNQSDNIVLGVAGGLLGGAALGAGMYHAASLRQRRKAVTVPESVRTHLASYFEAHFSSNDGNAGRLAARAKQILEPESEAAQAAREAHKMTLLAELRGEDFRKVLGRQPDLGARQLQFDMHKLDNFLKADGKFSTEESSLYAKAAQSLSLTDGDPARLFGRLFPGGDEQRNILKIVGRSLPRAITLGADAKTILARTYTLAVKPNLNLKNQRLYERLLSAHGITPPVVR